MQIQFFYSAINRFRHISNAQAKKCTEWWQLSTEMGFLFAKVFESLCIKIKATKRSLFVQIQNWNVFFPPRLVAMYYLMTGILYVYNFSLSIEYS